MTTVQEAFGHVFRATGPLEAICRCDPPGARGGSGLPWYYSLLNLVGIVKVKRKEREIYLGLANGNLIHIGVDDGGDVCSKAAIPLGEISNVSIANKTDYDHVVSFEAGGKKHDYVTNAYYVGMHEAPQQTQDQVRSMEYTILQALQNQTQRN